MSETAKGEKAKPSDADLKGELAGLESKRKRYADGIVEMDARISALKAQLGIK